MSDKFDDSEKNNVFIFVKQRRENDKINNNWKYIEKNVKKLNEMTWKWSENYKSKKENFYDVNFIDFKIKANKVRYL